MGKCVSNRMCGVFFAGLYVTSERGRACLQIARDHAREDHTIRRHAPLRTVVDLQADHSDIPDAPRDIGQHLLQLCIARQAYKRHVERFIRLRNPQPVIGSIIKRFCRIKVGDKLGELIFAGARHRVAAHSMAARAWYKSRMRSGVRDRQKNPCPPVTLKYPSDTSRFNASRNGVRLTERRPAISPSRIRSSGLILISTAIRRSCAARRSTFFSGMAVPVGRLWWHRERSA